MAMVAALVLSLFNGSVLAAEPLSNVADLERGPVRTLELGDYKVIITTKSEEETVILRAEDWKNKTVTEGVVIKDTSNRVILTFDAIFSFDYSPKLMEAAVVSVDYDNEIRYNLAASVTSVGRSGTHARYNLLWELGSTWEWQKHAYLIFTVTPNGTWSSEFSQWN